MIGFILGLFIGTIAGAGLMCISQINRYEEIEKNNKEVEE